MGRCSSGGRVRTDGPAEREALWHGVIDDRALLHVLRGDVDLPVRSRDESVRNFHRCLSRSVHAGEKRRC